MSDTIQKKVCILGAFAVGKTSLVTRYVQGIFSEQYRSTIGVRVDKKQVVRQGRQTTLVLWDIAGEDEFASVPIGYLRGAAGYLLVADGTRGETLQVAAELRARVERQVGKIPFVFLLNKVDLSELWTAQEQTIHPVAAGSLAFVCTSAKTGKGVEHAFDVLTEGITL